MNNDIIALVFLRHDSARTKSWKLLLHHKL